MNPRKNGRIMILQVNLLSYRKPIGKKMKTKKVTALYILKKKKSRKIVKKISEKFSFFGASKVVGHPSALGGVHISEKKNSGVNLT